MLIGYYRRASGLSPELRGQLKRIGSRYAEVRALARRDRSRFSEVSDQVARLRQGAEALTRQIARFGRLQHGLDAEALGNEIDALRQRSADAERADLKLEIDSTLVEKRRLLEALQDAGAQQSRYRLRLAKIEAVLEATRLAIPMLGAAEDDLVAVHGSRQQQNVLTQIRSEVRFVEEALEDLREP